MEVLINGGLRSEGLTVKVNSPTNDADFALGNKGEALVPFRGTIEGSDEVEQGTLVLIVFNNKDSNKPIVSVDLEPRKDDSNSYAFQLRQRLKALPGLYYFTIEQGEGEIIYAGKFTLG